MGRGFEVKEGGVPMGRFFWGAPAACHPRVPPDVKHYAVFVGHGTNPDGGGTQRLNIQRILKVNRTLFIGDRSELQHPNTLWYPKTCHGGSA